MQLYTHNLNYQTILHIANWNAIGACGCGGWGKDKYTNNLHDLRVLKFKS